MVSASPNIERYQVSAVVFVRRFEQHVCKLRKMRKYIVLYKSPEQYFLHHKQITYQRLAGKMSLGLLVHHPVHHPVVARADC